MIYKSRKKLFLIIAIVLISGVLAYVFIFNKTNTAPNIEITTSSGKIINFNNPLKPILVNFWATSCPSCIAEMPHIAEMKKRLGDDFDVVAISMQYDDINQVTKYIQKHDYPFIFVQDTQGKYSEAFGKVFLTPTSFLINASGKIVYYKIGTLDFDLVEEIVKQIVKQMNKSVSDKQTTSGT